MYVDIVYKCYLVIDTVTTHVTGRQGAMTLSTTTLSVMALGTLKK
jgi:hypothetical protein